MSLVQEIIIIGGGSSINEGLALGLKEKLNGKLVITTNFSFHHFESTMTVGLDETFFSGFINGGGLVSDRNKNHIEDLTNIPLLGVPRKGLLNFYLNGIWIPTSNAFHQTSPLTKGFYIGERALCGIYALHIALWLGDYHTPIFLLGFDGGAIDGRNTHYYSEITHKGIGKSQIYENEELMKSFNYFKKFPIYNVSPQSHISSLTKIDYPTMFSRLSAELYDIEALRTYIREKFLCKP